MSARKHGPLIDARAASASAATCVRCPVCAGEITISNLRGRPRVYCSSACAKHAKQESRSTGGALCAYCGIEPAGSNGYCSKTCRQQLPTDGVESIVAIEARYQAALAVEKHKRRNGYYDELIGQIATGRSVDPCVDCNDGYEGEC